MIGVEKAMAHAEGNGTLDDFLQVGDKAIGTDSREIFIVRPIVAIVHPELDHHEIRPMGSHVVVHALERLPGGIPIYAGVLDDEGDPVIIHLAKINGQVRGPSLVGVDELTEANGITEQVEFNGITLHRREC